MTEAIVLGGLVTDMMSYAPRFPVAGETLVAHGFQMCYGGKGANTAFMSARLDVKTALVAKCGDDSFGENYQKYLTTMGLDISQITIEKNCATSVSTITVTDDGENTIVYYPGAADNLTVKDIENAEVLFPGAKIFASVFETQIDNVVKGLELSKKHNLTTYINAAPIVPKPLPKACLPLIDYLCLNEIEGSALVCKLKGVPTEKLAEQDIVNYLLENGANTIILTRGAKGAAFASKENPKLTHVPGEKVSNVVDTTGAGDGFNGGFIYQLVNNSNLPIETKVAKACGIASLSVQKRGTQPSYPTKSEVPEKFL